MVPRKVTASTDAITVLEQQKERGGKKLKCKTNAFICLGMIALIYVF